MKMKNYRFKQVFQVMKLNNFVKLYGNGISFFLFLGGMIR